MKKSFLVLTILILFFNCWERQHHEITKPKTPVYSISGVVRDIDSKSALSDIEINIDGTLVKTDSAGYYYFPPIFTVGDHQVLVKRDGYVVFLHTIVLSYGDRTYDIYVPKVLAGEVVTKFTQGNPTGICWKNSTLYIMSVTPPDDENPFYDVKIYSYNYKTSKKFNLQTDLTLSLSKEFAITGLYNYFGSFWFAVSSSSKSTLIEISSTGRINTRIDLSFSTNDITHDDSYFWLSNGYYRMIKILNWGNEIEQYFAPGVSTAGIAWDGKHIWSTDTNENMLYEYYEDMTVKNTYKLYLDHALFPDDELNWISHIAFDLSGNPWGIGDNGKIVKFSL